MDAEHEQEQQPVDNQQPVPHKNSEDNNSYDQKEEKLQQRKKQDAKSIFIENVDYKSTKQDLQLIFEDCGTITRVTILKDPFTKQPKGCAYLSFDKETDVDMALNLSGTKLRGRPIKVQRKRTNIVGMSKSTPNDRKYDMISQMVMQYRTPNNFRGKPRARGK